MRAKLMSKVLFVVLSMSSIAGAVDSDPNFTRAVTAATAEVGQNSVKLFDRDSWSFHYQHVPNENAPVNFLNAGDPSVQASLKQTLLRFFNAKQTTGNYFGDGLYVAFDPVTTQNYGRPDFGLFIVELNKGARFLDFRNGMDRTLSGPTRVALSLAGCQIQALSEAFSGTADSPSAVSDPVCRSIATEVVKNLKIDFLLYSYWSYSIEGCDNNEDNSMAAIILNPDLIQASNSFALSKTIPTSDAYAEPRANIEKLSRKVGMSNNIDASLWPQLSVDATNIDQNWVKQHIYYCN